MNTNELIIAGYQVYQINKWYPQGKKIDCVRAPSRLLSQGIVGLYMSYA